jgi:hypothetical protein
VFDELRFRDGKKARKLHRRLGTLYAWAADICSPEQTPVPVAAPTEPVQRKKAVAKVGHPAKAKSAPTGSLEPHKPGPVMRAAMAERAKFRGLNPWERQLLKRELADPEFKARQDGLRAWFKQTYWHTHQEAVA